jgi:hypothetical protein
MLAQGLMTCAILLGPLRFNTLVVCQYRAYAPVASRSLSGSGFHFEIQIQKLIT